MIAFPASLSARPAAAGRLSCLRPVRPLIVTACCLACAPSSWAAGAAGAAVPPAAAIQYTVRAGDSAASISHALKLSGTQWQEVAQYNQLDPHKPLTVGSTVRIPLSVLKFRAETSRLIQTTGGVKVNGQASRSGVYLNENSRIATDAGSSAVVELPDGSRVKVLPHSVADISQSRYYQAPQGSVTGKVADWFAGSLKLVQGALETAAHKLVQRAKPLEVETTTSIIGVRGTEFRVASADQTVHKDRAEVLEGVVNNANTWKHTDITLHQGQGAVVDPNVAEMQAVTLLPAPKVPAPGQVLRLPEARWSFQSQSGAVAYRIVAAMDPKFESIAYSEKMSTPLADFSALPPGKWYIHARGVDQYGLEGMDATTMVVLKNPDWILQNAAIQATDGKPTLGWSGLTYGNGRPIPGTATVQAEISPVADFSRQVARAESAPDARTLVLPEVHANASYYLRVHVRNEALAKAADNVYRFTMPLDIGNKAYSVLLDKMPEPPEPMEAAAAAH